MSKDKFEELARAGELERAGQQETIDGDGFYISYAIAGSGPTGDETALVQLGAGPFGNRFFILNGDWREVYRPLVQQGYDACKALFDREKGEHINFWSDEDSEEEEL